VIFLIHLLEHLGLPSGVAIAIVVAARKLLKAATARMSPDRNRARDRRSIGGYR
jgi:hypothetical protein